ncbi:hypothetical protein AB0I28_32720 [Phytomonospora sp. NPDC050363]|uniref:hypothetical protein n=1 Tax=Phytomonospora sp. NPDC050363 TaxID=3155642 RepID=UPI0033CD360F
MGTTATTKTIADAAAPPPPPDDHDELAANRGWIHHQKRQLKPYLIYVGVLGAAALTSLAAELSGAHAQTALAAASVLLVATIVAAAVCYKKKTKPIAAAVAAVGSMLSAWYFAVIIDGWSWTAVSVLTALWLLVSAPYWNKHRIPNRTACTDLVLRPRADLVNRPPATGIDLILANWRDFVAVPDGALPGTTLTDPEIIPTGFSFTLQLRRGKQTAMSLVGNLGIYSGISSGLWCRAEDIQIERHPLSDALAKITIRTGELPDEDVTWTGPSYNPDTGCIGIGRYIDGVGEALWRVYRENSIFSGFICGATGMGKSYLTNILALALMHARNTVIWYADPARGASSPLLAGAADYFARSHLAADGSDDHSEIEEMLDDAIRLIDHRLEENYTWGIPGFTPSDRRPGVVIVIDECHKPLTVRRILRKATMVAREGRKVGIAVYLLSQGATLEAFGGHDESDTLRSNTTNGNVVAFSTGTTNTKSVITGLNMDPSTIKADPGLAFLSSKNEHQREALFRSYTAEDLEALYANAPKITLDAAGASVLGERYLNRHVHMNENNAALKNRVLDRQLGRAPQPRAPITPVKATPPTAAPGSVGIDVDALTEGFEFVDYQAFVDKAIVSSTLTMPLKAQHHQILALVARRFHTRGDIVTHASQKARQVDNILRDLVTRGLLSNEIHGRYELTDLALALPEFEGLADQLEEADRDDFASTTN